MTGLLDFVASIVDLLAPGFSIAAGQFDLEIFADMHRADALVTHVFKRVLNRLALRVEDGFFWSNNNFRFHVKTPA